MGGGLEKEADTLHHMTGVGLSPESHLSPRQLGMDCCCHSIGPFWQISPS